MSAGDVRSGCRGVVALTARLEPWQAEICAEPARIAGWLAEYGSPLNLIDPTPLATNAAQLTAAAAAEGVELGIFFARKANKALAFVDEALQQGLGIDVASERELAQTLERGVPPGRVVVTAAVKPAALLTLCVDSGATVVIDNEDELAALVLLAERSGARVPVALRLAPALGDATRQTRFGLPAAELLAVVDRQWPAGHESALVIEGLHFHLDGYDAGERVDAIGQSLELIDALRERGHRPSFVDMGGGIPMSYLDDAGEWERFWEEHRRGLLGSSRSLTFDGHGLGLSVHAGEVVGRANIYPSCQEPTGGAWLQTILRAPAGGPAAATIADALRARAVNLRCEPGRSLADGCGLTAARVEFRKQRLDGTWLIGVAMNRTQCRSTSDDFLVDPLLLRVDDPDRSGVPAPAPIEGYLVGAYCIERELLTWRRLAFPRGVVVGDIVVFPNTAGYLMHILESASHQIPLARNLVVTSAGAPVLDRIDAVP